MISTEHCSGSKFLQMPHSFKVKTVARDQSYIDYTAEQVGVRIRPGSCRSIILQRGRWTEYGVPYALPVDARLIDFRKTSMSSLACNVTQVEGLPSEGIPAKSELRALLSGELEFDRAVAADLQLV